MEVRVAVKAGGELQTLLGLPLTVAFAALQSKVFSLERIACLVMVEVSCFDQTPALAAMTGSAVHPQFAFMHIGMTAAALGKRQAGEPLVVGIVRKGTVGQKLMTLCAENRLMLSCQDEFGHRMIEPRRRLPDRLIVAFGTLVAQLAAMFIPMTSGACRPKSEIRAAPIDLLLRPQDERTDVLRRMTLAAGQRSMFPLKWKSGEGMVKGGFTVFPVNQSDFAPLVLHVALLTGSILLTAVQPRSGVALILDADMADKAFVRHQFVITTVTVGAVRDPLEKGVCLVQIAGR